MEPRRRLYDAVLDHHLARYRQMALVTGPRQVGKTTTCRVHADHYLSWDNLQDRRVILKGPRALADQIGASRLMERPAVLALDELHKYGRWKIFLKGFFDAQEGKVRLIVTGSSRLDVYRRGGDSMMGRYFLYRMHPWSVAEINRVDLPEEPIRPPRPCPDPDYDALWEHGGFPEPFLMRDKRFSARWLRLRIQQLFREDLRDLTRVQELGQIEMLASLLNERAGGRVVLSNLASDLSVSVDTVRRWMGTLTSLHHGFLVRPWSGRVIRSLRKEPKWYPRDWSGVAEAGARVETFVACHLLKAVEGWTDLGLGEFGLHYVRDKEKREVDFLVSRDGKPWFLVEVKKGADRLDPALGRFQGQLRAEHAFQVVFDMPYVNANCFKEKAPVVVPARTLLSQLL
jgi:predicted AAA+ superfamily ATPase